MQGVHYRAHTKIKAEALGVTGFVQNLPDGRVLIEAEGLPEQLGKLVRWCHRGSPGSVVHAVAVTTAAVTGFSDFVIRRG